MSGWITFQSAKLARVDQFSVGVDIYGDMSGRVMSTLETMAPELEVYSIDKSKLYSADA